MENLKNEGGMEISTLKEAFSWFAELSKELLILLDSKGRIKYINASLEKALQYDLSEVAGMNYLELVHKDDRNKSNELFCAVQNNQFPPPIQIDIAGKTVHILHCFGAMQKQQRKAGFKGWASLLKRVLIILGKALQIALDLVTFLI